MGASRHRSGTRRRGSDSPNEFISTDQGDAFTERNCPASPLHCPDAPIHSLDPPFDCLGTGLHVVAPVLHGTDATVNGLAPGALVQERVGIVPIPTIVAQECSGVDPIKARH
jgi:hypothetical protein